VTPEDEAIDSTFRGRRARRRQRRAERGPGRRRAVYVLPNLVTTGAILLGFYSIVQSIHQNFVWAALAIIGAGICDSLDGRIARATRSTSQFGVEYDSLSDVISFGLAPALLVYNWTLMPLGPRGWLIASVFAICAAMRLARFNVHASEEKQNFYQGIPTTTAGGIVAVTVLFVSWLGLAPPFDRALGLTLNIGFAGVALLMVSSVPYPAWGVLPVSGRNAYTTLVGVVLGLVALSLYHQPAFFAVSMLYLLSGPVYWLVRRRRTQTHEVQPEESTSDVGP